MPRPNNELPDIGQVVRFRIDGDDKIWRGTYTEEGFQVCNGFICYEMEQVNYWRPDSILHDVGARGTKEGSDTAVQAAAHVIFGKGN